MLNRTHPAGSTLLELLCVLVLLSLLGGAIMRLVVSQRRFLDAASLTMEVARSVREGAEIPREELRAVSASSGGIYELADDHLDFRSLTASSVLCTIDSSRSVVSIPARLAWSALTSWVAAPREGDTLLVLDSSADTDAPTWRVHTLQSVPSPGGRCPAATGLARTASEESDALTFEVAPPLEHTIEAGSALRVFRRARYELYRAGDGRWYLGYLDCAPFRATPCSNVQPVSGPYTAAGIRFSYRDSSGATTVDPKRVARIEVRARAESRVELRAGGFARGFRSESLAAAVGLRNR